MKKIIIMLMAVMLCSLTACKREPTVKKWTEEEVCELFEKDENNKE